MTTGWIGFDLDGTLAEYDGWKGIEHIGAPVPWALVYVKELLDLGIEVRIVTARVQEGPEAIEAIKQWCLYHCGKELTVTDKKDMSMVALIDDRAYGPLDWNALPSPRDVAGAIQWHHSSANPGNPEHD